MRKKETMEIVKNLEKYISFLQKNVSNIKVDS